MAVFSPYFLESSAAPRLCQHPYRSHMPPPSVCARAPPFIKTLL